MGRRYYVIKENGQWKVKLEQGRVLRTFGTNRGAAINHAKDLGKRNNRDVMVNYADGRTGAAYHDYTSK